MKNKLGFTLVEMLAVVLIIGILTVVAVPQYRRAIQKAEATEAMHMLRVIYDSSERLAVTLGYRNFQAMRAAGDSRANFSRMDMFDPESMPCTFDSGNMICGNYEYHLEDTHIEATKITGTRAQTQFRLYRGDVPRLTCIDLGEVGACDIYNVPVDEEDNGTVPGDKEKEKQKELVAKDLTIIDQETKYYEKK